MYTVDASVWVNGFDQREAGHEISRQFLDAIRLRKVPIIDRLLRLPQDASS